ncbi:hypothetical protein RRG08_059122 [Elysia crispata]|uniref:Uncharacterized protein n=1 Tax=Elysia crispata TaxID=231223 RepID=A0AAE1CNR1_9GAST|nr:hypothetical protein RRG08_059122 [Elysia crispata]
MRKSVYRSTLIFWGKLWRSSADLFASRSPTAQSRCESSPFLSSAPDGRPLGRSGPSTSSRLLPDFSHSCLILRACGFTGYLLHLQFENFVANSVTTP